MLHFASEGGGSPRVAKPSISELAEVRYKLLSFQVVLCKGLSAFVHFLCEISCLPCTSAGGFHTAGTQHTEFQTGLVQK